MKRRIQAPRSGRAADQLNLCLVDTVYTPIPLLFVPWNRRGSIIIDDSILSTGPIPRWRWMGQSVAYPPATHAPVSSIAPARSFKSFSVILIFPTHRGFSLCARSSMASETDGVGKRNLWTGQSGTAPIVPGNPCASSPL